MKVEFVGLGATHGYVHEESTNLKKLAKQITEETGVATDIRSGSGKDGDVLVVAGNIVPLGGAVVIKGGSASTLSIAAFKSQYQEIVDFDTTAVDKSLVSLEKRLDSLESFRSDVESKAVVGAKAKAVEVEEPKAVEVEEPKASGKK